MTKINVINVKYNNMINMNQFINEQLTVPNKTERITFDFNQLKWIDPSGAVICLNTIERLQEMGIPIEYCPIINPRKSAISYSINMGIFQKLGLSSESCFEEGETYLSPNKVYISEVYKQLDEEGRKIEIYYDDVSKKIVEKVLRSKSKDYDEKLKDLFTYIVREVIRNIFDHSESECFYYGSQYIPANNEVELVIADKGLGITNTIPFDAEEKWYNKNTTDAAIIKAFTPGITAASNHSYAPDDYKNSGFGLAMVKRIIGTAGGILSMATLDKSVTFENNSTNQKDCNIPGTLIRFRIQLDNLSNVNFDEQLDSAIKEARELGFSLGPSKASRKLKSHSEQHQKQI